jgi:hypothetical protein
MPSMKVGTVLFVNLFLKYWPGKQLIFPPISESSSPHVLRRTS